MNQTETGASGRREKEVEVLFSPRELDRSGWEKGREIRSRDTLQNFTPAATACQ
jgi:hypothetical protein